MPSARDETLARVRERAEALLGDAEDGGRAWARAERVYGLARRLARQEEADRFVVGVAALLGTLPELELAAELARLRLGQGATAAIREAVAGLAREQVADLGLEARVLWDADRLDALGALGIADLLLDERAQVAPLYHRADPFALLRDLAPDRFLLDQLYARVAALPRALHTPTARTIANRRAGIMLFFLEALRDELAETLPDAALPEGDWLVPREAE